MSNEVSHTTNGAPDQVADDPLAGLIRQCQRCKAAREAVGELNAKLKGVVLIGTVLDDGGDYDLDQKGKRLAGPFRVECDECQGSGHELHPRGKRLMGLVKRYLDHAHEDWIKTPDDEIPF